MGRDERIDTIKGFLICLVVLGHFISIYGNGDVIQRVIMIFIYSFHMPLFVMISGFLTNTQKKLFQNISKIIETFLVAQTVCLVTLTIWGGQIEILDMITPYWTLWYLLSLVFWKTITYYLTPVLSNNTNLILAVCVILSIVCGYISNGRLLSIQRTISFYPFFLYGYYMRKGKLDNFVKNKKTAYIILLMALCLAILLSKYSIILSIEKGADPYHGILLMVKAMLIPCSLLISLSIWYIFGYNHIFSFIGKKSLSIYVYHTIFISFVFLPIAHHFELPKVTIALVLYCISLIFILTIWSLTKLSQYLLNPISVLIKKADV